MKRKRIIIFLVSAAIALMCLIGNSFIKTGSFEIIEKYVFYNILSFIVLLFVFEILLTLLFNVIDKNNLKDKVFKSKIFKLFDTHPFIFSLIFILICWAPYIISFYPIILSPDPSYQIMQFFGIDNKYSTYSVLLDKNVIITNHHPVIHTVILGSMLWLGRQIGSDNLGLFFYSIIQILILSCTLSYTIKFLKEIKVPNIIRIIVLLIYALTPVFPFYAMSGVKDVIYSSLIILYVIRLCKFLKTENKIDIKIFIKTVVLLILIILFRNNGIYVIIFSLPLLLLLNNKVNFKKYLLLIIITIFFNISYNNFILPYFKITPSSIREALSIPFQQTARYVKYYGNELTENEKNAIDNILDYNSLSTLYKPELSDDVKSTFNKYYTSNELKEYFKVWLNSFKRHPLLYIESTINNTYGYFYPLKTNWYIYYKYDKRIVNKDFDYYYIDDFKPMREILSSYGLIFPYIVGPCLIVNIGFNSWLLIIFSAYLIYKRKYKYLIIFSPLLTTLLICFASPANTYFRYAMPYIFSMPMIISIMITLNKTNDF